MRGRKMTVSWVAIAGAIGALAFAACQTEGNVAPTSNHGAHDATTISAAQSDAIEEILPLVKQVTQPFVDFNAAQSAGYNAQLTACFSNPPIGGMGFHYGNPTLIDGVVQALKPEILLYEPLQNGTLQFVGVEYVVPYTAWTKPNPPSLAGIPFHRNDAFGLWILHAWVGKPNPRGTLFDWNPTVSCKFASSVNK